MAAPANRTEDTDKREILLRTHLVLGANRRLLWRGGEQAANRRPTPKIEWREAREKEASESEEGEKEERRKKKGAPKGLSLALCWRRSTLTLIDDWAKQRAQFIH